MNQYLIRAYTAPNDGRARTFYALANDHEDAAVQFHTRQPHAIIRDMWQLVPPGYFGTGTFSPDRDRDLSIQEDQ